MFWQFLIFGLIMFLFSRSVDLSEKIESRKKFTIIRNLIDIATTTALFLLYLINPLNIGILIFSLGMFLNTMVMVANKGFMPVDVNLIKQIYHCLSDEEVGSVLRGQPPNTQLHIELNESSKFKILADRFQKGSSIYSGSNIYSIGDVFIDIGSVFITIHFVLLVCLITIRLFTDLISLL